MAEQKNRHLKRIIVDVGDELHLAVKSRAALRNVSMRTWVVRALVAAITKEEWYEKKKNGESSENGKENEAGL